MQRSFFQAARAAHWLSLIIDRQQKGERADAAQLAIRPNVSSMSLNQPLCKGQPETHARRRTIDAHKILEDFLMMLGSNAGAGIADGHTHRIRFGFTLAAAVGGGQLLGDAALPKMQIGPQRDTAARGGLFESVIAQTRDGP